MLKEQRRVFLQQIKTSKDSIVDSPAYAVVFLIHTLAHGEELPSNYYEDETSFPEFCRYFLMLDLSALLQTPLVHKWFLWLEKSDAHNHFLTCVPCFADSPLYVMLRELVEIDSFNGTEHGPAASSVSVLSGIFRAIQKAEDPSDSEITQVYLLVSVRDVLFAYHFVFKH